MTPKEKAYELVDKFFMPLPLTSQVLTKVNNITFEYDDWEVAKKCALISVDEVLSIKNLPKEETLFYKKVKPQIKKL
jgi:hypothetical protein